MRGRVRINTNCQIRDRQIESNRRIFRGRERVRWILRALQTRPVEMVRISERSKWIR